MTARRIANQALKLQAIDGPSETQAVQDNRGCPTNIKLLRLREARLDRWFRQLVIDDPRTASRRRQPWQACRPTYRG